MHHHRLSLSIFIAASMMLNTGCASYTTLNEGKRGTAKVYSGTRLDIKALNGDMLPTRKFPAAPPEYPALDLPLSFVMDSVLFPVTLSAVIFESFLE